MGKSIKKCSPRKYGVKSHNRKGSRRVKSHCRKYRSRSRSRKTRSKRKSGCKKGSKRVSFTAKGKKVSFCAKKRSTRRRRSTIKSSSRRKSPVKSTTSSVVKKGSLCQGLNNYDCNINPNCMYITDKNNKSYCKGRSDVLKKGNIYAGPMGKPSNYVETSTAPSLPAPLKYTFTETPTTSESLIYNVPTLI